jgi:hypothetical protein
MKSGAINTPFALIGWVTTGTTPTPTPTPLYDRVSVGPYREQNALINIDHQKSMHAERLYQHKHYSFSI